MSFLLVPANIVLSVCADCHLCGPWLECVPHAGLLLWIAQNSFRIFHVGGDEIFESIYMIEN